ncbi:MAG: hypothetical protein ACFFCS_03475 [Candidatus Hodarchaeota archaeon]
MKNQQFLKDLGKCTGLLFVLLGALIASMDWIWLFLYRYPPPGATLYGLLIALIGVPFLIAVRIQNSREEKRKSEQMT